METFKKYFILKKILFSIINQTFNTERLLGLSIESIYTQVFFYYKVVAVYGKLTDSKLELILKTSINVR